MRSASSYDAVIVGGGHNGLVCAAYLARAAAARQDPGRGRAARRLRIPAAGAVLTRAHRQLPLTGTSLAERAEPMGSGAYARRTHGSSLPPPGLRSRPTRLICAVSRGSRDLWVPPRQMYSHRCSRRKDTQPGATGSQ